MSRHSKNNCSAPVFTYSERQKLKNEYGTLARRVGKDSQKEVDSCSLCLHPVRDPLAWFGRLPTGDLIAAGGFQNFCEQRDKKCSTSLTNHACGPLNYSPKGHIFCRECIYANMLTQKKELKKKLKSWEEQQKLAVSEEQQRKLKEEEEKIKQFERTEISVVPVGPARGSATSSSTSSSAPLVSLAIGAKANIDPLQRRTESYWLPSDSPDAVIAKVEKPSMDTKCPMGHNLKLKQLVKVDFTLTKGVDVDNLNLIGRYSCHPCQKTLNSVSAVALMKPCGHVICKACSDKFVTPKGAERNTRQCCICYANLPLDSDIIMLQASGSSYAGGSGEEKMAKVATPAPRFG